MVAGCSSTSPRSTPEPSATATLTTAALQQALDALVAAGAPAAVVEVVSGDRRWTGSAGVLTRGNPAVATGEAPFRISGITKSMVAAVILDLVAEKRLTLDTDVNTVVPGLLPRAVTIEQLLEQTSGLPNYTATMAPPNVDSILANSGVERTDADLVAAALTQPWTQNPGSSYVYSDTNYVVLGEVIRTLDGGVLADSLQRRIFGPAGMTATRYPADAAMPPGALHGYLVNGTDYKDATSFTPSFFGGAGALVSTVADVNRFYRALFTGKIVPPALVALMQEKPESGYGLGVVAARDTCGTGSKLLFGQRGNGYGYRSVSFSSPDGSRQLTLAWTASGPDPTRDPLEQQATAAINAAITSTCPTGV
ncbi:beta-lactamase family protein [Williamsia sp. CHRR-6]|nr:beta-lactamase family protein [Williamsia sp. CHRR-6]